MSRVTRRHAPLIPRGTFYAKVDWWRWLIDAADAAVERWLHRPRIGDTRDGASTVTFRPRDHFRSDGTAKVKRTKAEAKEFCQTHSNVRFYECSVCGAWHVGHADRSEPVVDLSPPQFPVLADFQSALAKLTRVPRDKSATRDGAERARQAEGTLTCS